MSCCHSNILIEDLRCCSGVDNESVQICGGNECIRSSTACHLIIPFKGSYVCGGHHDTYRYNSYEQANSIKKCLLPISRQHSGTADIPKLVVTLYTEV